MQKSLNLYFSLPVLQEQIISNLEYYVIDLSRNDEGVHYSNEGGYQSLHFQRPEREFQDLWEQIEQKLNIYHNMMKLKGHVQITDWWFNINYKGSSNNVHQHPLSIHSGVYYIKTPPKCGDLCFSHPNESAIWGWPSHLIKENNSMNSSRMSINPVKNTLHIFPSWATHYVLPNLSDEMRISLSFNSGLIQ